MKKLFMKKAPKEATVEENKEYLDTIGVPTYKGKRESKFNGFKEYAQQVHSKNKKDYNAGGVEMNADAIYQKQQNDIYGPGGNPYAQARAQKAVEQQQSQQAPTASNPYAQAQSSQGNPYAQANGSAGGNPYAQAGRNPYLESNSYAQQGSGVAAAAGTGAGANSGSGAGSSNPYGAAAPQGLNPYAAAQPSSASTYAESTYAPSNAREELFADRKKEFNFSSGNELDELNDLPDDTEELDELNGLPDQDAPRQRQQSVQQQQEPEEDEELEELRNQIRFTKKESLSSTQNTLRLAAEAEASGRNALGMLGSQGERIANTERSLALAKNQTKIATEKNAELARLNRSIFVPNVSNPFTSKRRLHEKEARIKSEYAQEQVAREHRRQTAFESERRVIEGLNVNGVAYSDTAMRHKKEQMRNDEGRKKFQFEADSEDEDLEDELELNMEGINNAAGRMKNLALSMGEEVDSQNRRLDRITRQTDELDIDVHLNAARLAAIK